jgi:hypothetical protein
MITVPEASEKIINRSRYLSEAMSKGIINLSSLARYIKPEIEEMLLKKISSSSVIMALKRLKAKLKPPQYKNVFKTSPEMILWSNLTEINIINSYSFDQKYQDLLKLSNENRKHFLTITRGISETVIVASNSIYSVVNKMLKEEKIIFQFANLSSVGIRLPKEAEETPGVFYFFLKSLAWEGINIIEIVSTASEFTLILEDKDANKAFSILKSLFN